MALMCISNVRLARSNRSTYFISSLSVKQASSQRGSFILELSSSGMAYGMCDCALCQKGAGTRSRGGFILHFLFCYFSSYHPHFHLFPEQVPSVKHTH